jgi:ABC-2 type transport system ATP-binding protein
VLSIRDLQFSYGKRSVYTGFNLDIPPGQICLLTGINGVGKSTLLRLIAGVLRPKKGTIVYPETMGSEPRRKIGFISDQLSLYESLTVDQTIRFHCDVFGLDRIDDRLIRLTKIEGGRRVKELSTGQRTILHLNMILSLDPDLLLIDEVIHSIDAYLRRVFLEELIALIARKRVTVLMANLNFHDIEALIERVILLKSGTIAVDEPIETLKEKVKKIIAPTPPAGLTILSQRPFPDRSEYYVYPYLENSALRDAEVVDLDLTEIVAAFIGGEYAA